MAARALVHGLAVAGAATVRALQARGYEVVASDDRADEAKRTLAGDLGVEFVERPDDAALRRLVESSSIVSPAPGIPETHPIVGIAASVGVPLRSEIDLAYEWEQARPGGPRPMLTVTGTDGKTTTTLLAVHVLATAGVRSVACGNTEVPLVDALDLDIDVFVVEATSFRLAWTPQFRSEAAAWLNLAEDHLDWHVDMGTYEAAKARIWANMRDTDVAIGAVADPVVMRNLRRAGGRQVTFGVEGADYHLSGEVLMSPYGPLCSVSDMARSFPHDITNGLCAAASVLETGLADVGAVAEGIATFTGPPHRIERVVGAGGPVGVEWYDDSKATTPHAALTAISGFDSVVLIAGGRNKDLDLASLAAQPHRVRAVVTIGEAAPLVAAAFADVCPVVDAGDMERAVAAAADIARPGDAVLLSPGCASFDAYSGYAERGDHFVRLVRDLAREETP
jgi:UDP-N-acetylmuramoylalanine--D-glutamate ligase